MVALGWLASNNELKMTNDTMQLQTVCFIIDTEDLATAYSAAAEFSAGRVVFYVRGDIPLSLSDGMTFETHRLAGAEALDLELARRGETTEIIDSARDTAQAKAERVRQLLFALAPGGVYRILHAGFQRSGSLLPVRVAEILERVATEGGGLKVAESLSEKWEKEFAQAIATATQEGDGWTLLKAGRHLVRLRDADANDELERAFGDSWGKLIKTLPAAETPRPATLGMHFRKRPHQGLDSIGPTPSLHMREYDGAIVAPRQIAAKGNYFLPDTFRFHQHPTLNHDLLGYSSSTRSSADFSLNDAPELTGSYYYLDTIYPGHFGHVMTEVISRLWGWDEAKRIHPGIKALISVRNLGEKVPKYELDLLEAYGISNDDVYVLERPAKLQKLIAVTPMFHNTRYASPEISTLWNRIRTGMGISNDSKKNRKKIFVGRALSRGCTNAMEVEAAFRYYGFEVVRPERHSMKEQVEIFSSASVVAGFAGSGMFSTIFCDSPITKIVISQEAYNAVNEYLQSGVGGDDIHYFWCEPSLDHPPGQWLLAAFRSNFTFDFVTHGDTLYDLLATLE